MRGADRVLVQGRDWQSKARVRACGSCAEMFVVMICAGEGKFARGEDLSPVATVRGWFVYPR